MYKKYLKFVQYFEHNDAKKTMHHCSLKYNLIWATQRHIGKEPIYRRLHPVCQQTVDISNQKDYQVVCSIQNEEKLVVHGACREKIKYKNRDRHLQNCQKVSEQNGPKQEEDDLISHRNNKNIARDAIHQRQRRQSQKKIGLIES